MCTSHATAFLDNLRTHIVDFQDRRLKASKGAECNTLTLFVEKYLVKKAYFELSNETMKFAFPERGPLEGVKSRSKVVLRLAGNDDKESIEFKSDELAVNECPPVR